MVQPVSHINALPLNSKLEHIGICDQDVVVFVCCHYVAANSRFI